MSWQLTVNSIGWVVNPYPGITQVVTVFIKQTGDTGPYPEDPAVALVVNDLGEITSPVPANILIPDEWLSVDVMFIQTCSGASFFATGLKPCIAVDWADGIPTLPPAVNGEGYSFQAFLIGDAPFEIADIVKPDWMFLELDETGGNWFVSWSGIPDGDSNPPATSFKVTNCLDAELDFESTSTAEGATFNYNWVISSPETGGTLIIKVNGTEVLNYSTPASTSGTISLGDGDLVEVFQSTNPAFNFDVHFTGSYVADYPDTISIINDSFTVVAGNIVNLNTTIS